MTMTTQELDLMVEELYAAHQAAEEAAAKYKALEAAWKAQEDVKAAEQEKSSASAAKATLEKRAREWLIDYSQTHDTLDSSCFSIKKSVDGSRVSNEAVVVGWLIANMPGLAAGFLDLNHERLIEAMEENPLLKGVIPAEIVETTTTKTTIHWSKLAEGQKTAEQIRAEIKAKYQAIITEGNFVVLDMETTGLDVAVDEPVQIAVCSPTGDTLMNDYFCPSARLLNSPSFAKSEAVHGLSRDFLLNNARGDFTLTNLPYLIRGKTVLIYNADFDTAILRRMGINIPKEQAVCIMKDYARWNGEKNHFGYVNKKLSVAFEAMSSATQMAGTPHDAADDVFAALQVAYGLAGFVFPNGDAVDEHIPPSKPGDAPIPVLEAMGRNEDIPYFNPYLNAQNTPSGDDGINF